MAAFSPGLSPPAVKIPMRLVLAIGSDTFETVKGAGCPEEVAFFSNGLSLAAGGIKGASRRHGQAVSENHRRN
jgi:hypothetical protein